MSDDYVVDVHHLSKSFNKKPAVIDVSLKIKRGEIFGFLGPNGSGKTTTIRMLCGLMTPDSGDGECLGFDILHQSRMIKPLVGYVPQAFSLYQDLTVQENMEFVARVYGDRNYHKEVKKIMEDLGLMRYANVFAGRLSGGWKQRLSLAAALVHHPKLLLLDEPTAGVDPKARREFWDDITHLTSQGITALVSTHYMDEAERCNRLAYIVYGRLMTEGTVPEIIHKVGLTTWAAHGKNLVALSIELRKQPDVAQVVILGNEIRVCGKDATKLQQTLMRYSHYTWYEVETSLEEVFVYLVELAAEKRNTE